MGAIGRRRWPVEAAVAPKGFLSPVRLSHLPWAISPAWERDVGEMGAPWWRAVCFGVRAACASRCLRSRFRAARRRAGRRLRSGGCVSRRRRLSQEDLRGARCPIDSASPWTNTRMRTLRAILLAHARDPRSCLHGLSVFAWSGMDRCISRKISCV